MDKVGNTYVFIYLDIQLKMYSMCVYNFFIFTYAYIIFTDMYIFRQNIY